MKYINDKKENIYNILRVLIILHFCVVSNGQGCQGKPQVVASCPESPYVWIKHAKVLCTVSDNYHCLITENHRDDEPSIIECCMKPQNITRGHMPRYNLNKNELQEIECQEDYYMPTQFSSNRYRDHDVQHCKYMKSNCNMEGMKICNHGSTTTDRSCYCDYKELYVPDLPLDRGEHCFSVKDNLCNLRNDCDRTYQELNMMYQCVNVCKTGYFRPENEILCRLLPEGTTIAGKPTDDVSLPDNIKPTVKVSTASTSTKDNMVKPEIENHGSNSDNLVAIGVSLVFLFIIIGSIVIFIVVCVLRKYKKGKFEVKDEESSLVPEIRVLTAKFIEVYGSEIVLKVQLFSGFKSALWLYKDHDDDKQEIPSNNSKYSEFVTGILQPSLKIHHLCKKDVGSYFCKVTMDDETTVESEKIEVEVIEPVLSLTKPKEKADYGHEVTLECGILNPPKLYVIFWEKEVDGNIKELKISDETKEKYSGCTEGYPHLTIKDADHGDNALYCFCIKYTYPSSTEECEIFRSNTKIQLLVVNEPSIVWNTHKESVEIGKDISFGCTINHKPKKFEVIWEKIQKDTVEPEIIIFYEKNKEKYETYNEANPHLTIKNAEKSDDAYYRCCIKYSSSVGEQLVSSEKFHLNVNKANETTKSGDTHIGQMVQKNVYFKEAKHVTLVNDKNTEIKKDSSSGESTSDENDSESNKDQNGDDRTENSASGNEASSSNASGSEDQHARQTPRDIIDVGKEKKIKLQNLNPEEDSCFSEMERIAGLHGYVVKNVRADGNCLFHAISHYIGDQISEHPLIGEQKAKELRLQTVQYLEKNDTTPNGEKYASFLEDQTNDKNGDKWSQYLNSMKQQGTYGDELILRAISHHFSVHISVLSTESPERFSKYNPLQLNEQTKIIHLGFMHTNRHYVRLENKGTLHQQPSKNESSV
ncbi:uncharacterized protein [Mytilus edulis]|uniref:uncharacterized protein isoform X2 n=1 Tax=Mytilus edulis TaxID=6550 RepID=UPI0039EF8229